MVELIEKLVVLLSLVTDHRKQTLLLIKLSNIRKIKKGYEMKIPDRIKVTRLSACQLLLVLPKFETKPTLRNDIRKISNRY